MTHLRWTAAGCLAVLLCHRPVIALAANEGLADLDQATERKLAAANLNDLSQVIDLLQAALNKGLDDRNTAFAQQLLAESLLERATALTDGLNDRDLPEARIPRIRLWRVALSDLKRVVQLNAKAPRAHCLMGRLHILAGDRDQAIEALNQAINTAGDDQTALLAEALTLRGTLQPDGQQGRADLDRALALVPDRTEALLARARLLHEQGKHDAALADLDRAIELKPNDDAVHEQRASVLASQQDFNAALRSIDKAIELAPNSPAAFVRRAQVKLGQNDLPSALADLDRALEIDPQARVARLLRAHVRLLTSNPAGALDDVETTLRMQPGFLPAIRLRAEILASTGKLADAIGTLQALADVRPDDSALLLQLARYCLADHQSQRAIALGNQVLASDQQNTNALRLRGDAHLAVGNQAQAVADYDAALAIEPDESGLLNNLAWVLATSPNGGLRDGKRALELATKACEVTNYKEAHILSTLAAAYAEIGQFETAVEWSRKAVDLGQGTPHITQLQEELQSYLNKTPWRELQVVEEQPTQEPRPALPPMAEKPPAQPQAPDVSAKVPADNDRPPHGGQDR